MHGYFQRKVWFDQIESVIQKKLTILKMSRTLILHYNNAEKLLRIK